MSLQDLWSAYEGRITALDNWLLENLPSTWSTSLATRGLHPDSGMTKFQITEFMLTANFAVRTLLAEGQAAASQKLQSLPRINTTEIPEFEELKIASDHEFLRSDLAQVQHPSLPNGSVTPTVQDKNLTCIAELGNAARILELVPDLRSEALIYVSALCFVESPYLQRNGECISTSKRLTRNGSAITA